MQMLRDRGDDGNGSLMLAAVGQLQFEVVDHRMKNEYGVDCKWEAIGYTMARWVNGGWDAIKKAEDDGKLFGVHVAKDKWERPVRDYQKIDILCLEGYCSVMLLSYFISSGALGSPDLLL